MQMASLITHLMDLNLIGVLDEYANRHSNLRQINTHPLKKGRELQTKLKYTSVSCSMAVFIRLSFSKQSNRFQQWLRLHTIKSEKKRNTTFSVSQIADEKLRGLLLALVVNNIHY